MKFLVILALVGAALAAPKDIFGINLTPTDDGNATDSDDQPSSGFPFPFPNIFNQRPAFDVPSFPRFPSLFPRIPEDGSSGGDSFPGGPSEFPDNYDNSTHEVKIINGTRVEMNSTVTKQTGDDGNVIFRHFHIVRTLPGDDQVEGDAALVPDVTENEVQDGSEVPNSRSRRWILEWLKNAHILPGRRPNAIPGYVHKTRGSGESAEGDRAITNAPRRVPMNPDAHIPVDSDRLNTLDSNTLSPADSDRRTSIDNRIPIRNHDDLAVNYGIFPKLVNPDAEVFDIELMRADESRFYAGRSQPIRTQPIVSEPVRSQPIRSEPLAYEPRRTQPVRSELSEPIRYQPPRRTFVRI